VGNVKEGKTCVMERDVTKKRILMAEDHPLNAGIAAMILEGNGYTVDIAQDGAQAVDIFSEHEEGYYEAIIMDITMPVMDGYEATRIIREMPREDAGIIPIIALSAENGKENIEMAKESGMNEYISKPLVPEVLFRILDELR